MKYFAIIITLITIFLVRFGRPGFGSDDGPLLLGKLEKGNYPAIFHFGDSHSDTGAYSAVFGRATYPCGMTFFGKPTGRFCDGRVFLDFIAEKLGLPYVNAFLDAMSEDFRHGANFAMAAGTLKPVDKKLYGHGSTPISVDLQLVQFQQFKDRVEELHKQDGNSANKNRFPKPEDISKALYTIETGGNDLGLLISVNSEDQARKSIPGLINYFAFVIEELHKLGARNFLIHNIGPTGCLPQFVELFVSNPEKLDEIGCVKKYNNVVKEFNRLLLEKLSQLRIKLKDSSLFHLDMYSGRYELFRDAKKHGFIDPHGYCCKDCKSFFIPIWMRRISNDVVSYKFCDDPSKYISWDASHYTDAANLWLANRIFNNTTLRDVSK